MNSSYILLLSLLATSILASEILPLQTPTKVFIDKGKEAMFNVSISSWLSNSSNLIITASPIVQIPSQIPSLFISSSNFTQACLKDSNQLEGICIISSDNLVNIKGENIVIKASCTEKCQFTLEAYFSSAVQIKSNMLYTILPSSENIFSFEIQITNIAFDSLEIQAIFEKQSSNGGVQMFANIGNQSVLLPNQQSYQYKAISIKKGLGISIEKQKLTIGIWIKIVVYSQSTSIIDFSVITAENDKKKMIIGKDEQCFLSNNEVKIYILDFSTSKEQIQQYELNLAATIYSGSPWIEVSFKQDFSNVLNNYGVSGNLNYLISKQIREQNGFTDKIYIRISSTNSAFLVLKASFNPLDYVYVQEATTYLSFYDALDIENYIFDVYYTLKQGETEEKKLYFTSKIKVLEGFGEYASRICNKQSNQDCIVHNKQQFFSDAFMKQAADLPGSILQYFSLYEIFMFAKVKQCRKSPQKYEENRYLCKIHMVGFNPNKYGQLKWAITSYSRLNNILLVQGHPFKDLVYEDSYNYYSFIVPEDFVEITIFVTTLNGEITLVTSQIYPNPQIIFSYLQGNDIRSNPLNSIKYSQSEVIEKINIGVYGVSMSEFMVNVVVKRENQESRAVVLVENVQQYMHLEKGESRNFQLQIQEEGQWVVQVIEIYGEISTKLIGQNNTIICNSFSICRFNSSTFIEIIVNSSKQSKFTIVFYKKSSCRLFQLGSTNFLDIQANTSQCIQFIVTPKDTLISYSENILHKMMMHSISFSVKINENDLGKMDEHYSYLSQGEMVEFCRKEGNNSKESSCIMRIQVFGCKQEDVQAEISVFTMDEPIPLYDGVQFIYANNQVQQSKPAHFNYYALTEDKISLIVKSQNSFGYVLAYNWVEYDDYRQAITYDQIYPSHPALIDNINSFKIGSYQKNFKIILDDNKSNCTECILLISIFPSQTAKRVTFSIQATASQKMLKLGQTIDGKIGKDEFYLYQFQKIKGQSSAIISFSNFRSGSDCYRVNLIDKNSERQVSFKGSEAVLLNGREYYAIITGQTSQCKYSISFWSADLPVKIIQTGYSYNISLTRQSKLYFIYYHSDNNAFHLLQSIKSGSIYSYATPISTTIRKAIQDDKFLYKSQSIYDSIDITPDLSGFCSGCYYLIKIVGEPSVQGNIGVVDSNTFPSLIQGEVIRERVNKGQARKFSYYTFQKFRLKLSVIYGKIQLIVKNIITSAPTLYSITTDLVLDLDAGSNEELIAGYEFTLTMMEQSTYSLQVIREDKVRIIEGYPINHYFEANQSALFDYNQAANQNFNLQIVLGRQSKQLGIILQISTKQDPTFKQITSERIGNIFSFDIKATSSQYHIKITTTKAIELKLLITREQLTYLQPNSPILASNPTTYQIFTQGSMIMMEIFSCKGDVQIIASARYSDVMNSSSNAVTLEHRNIGGHYVIQSQEGQAEFFITVRSKTVEQPLFLVEYSMVEILPYKYFSNAEEAISYKMQRDSIELQIELPQLKEVFRNLRNFNAELKIFATSEAKYRGSWGQCGSSSAVYSNTVKIVPFPKHDDNTFRINLQKKQIASLLKHQSDPIYIGLSLTITFDQDKVSRKLTYIYESLEVYVTQSYLAVEGENSGVKFIIVWMILPLMFGAIIALLALKYCLKRWHLLSSNDENYLVQEQQSKNAQQNSQKSQIEQTTIQKLQNSTK